MTGVFQRSHARFAGIALLVLATAAAFIATAAPARAEEEIEFRIVGFGDQSCRTGSNRLNSSSAEPFRVEACAVEFGDGLPDRVLTVVVTHADSSTEEFEVTTGPDGSVIFQVVPVDAGLTTVEMCNENSCDFGVLEFEADSPPTPPAVASYSGPTIDMGTSEPITDGTDDFDDPYTGGPAELGSGEPAMDIESFRYLGVMDGFARFEINTGGDMFSYFSSGLPLVQVSMAVTTPDDARYLITYRVSDGNVETYAQSDGAVLEGVVVDIEEGSVILLASGIDVPIGSMLRAGTWLIDDPEHSGYQDYADGTAVAAAAEDEPVATETDTGTETEAETGTPEETQSEGDPGTPSVISEDGSGGGNPPWLLIALLIALVGGGTFLFTRTRSKPQDPTPPEEPVPPHTPTPPPPPVVDDDTETMPPRPENPPNPQTFSAEDSEFLQEIYKGADAAGLKVVGKSTVNRLEDKEVGKKDAPVKIGKTGTIVLRVGEDGSVLHRRGNSDKKATSIVFIDVIPEVVFDSDDDGHVRWIAYARQYDVATARLMDTSKSGSTTKEWESKFEGRKEHEVGNDPEFKDWMVNSMPTTAEEAVRQALTPMVGGADTMNTGKLDR